MKFSIKDFFSKCDQIRRKLSIHGLLSSERQWKLAYFKLETQFQLKPNFYLLDATMWAASP